MKQRLALWAGLVALVFAACERPPDVAQPSAYAKDELAFSFPGNWSVTEDEATSDDDGSFRNVVIESPGNAIVLIQLYTPAIELSAEEFSDELMRSTIAEVEGLIELKGVKPLTATGGPASAVQSVVAGVMRDGVERNFEIKVLGQGVPHRARTFRVEGEGSVVFLIEQSATEDWDRVHPGFELIASTLALQ